MEATFEKSGFSNLTVKLAPQNSGQALRGRRLR
jgi:hypothetical protein